MPEQLDPVAAQVLAMMAEQQRNFHEQNRETLAELLETAKGMQRDVHDITVDVAILIRDVADIKLWRVEVDKFIDTTRDNVSEAKGGLKGFRLAMSLGISGTIGAILTKVLPGLTAGLLK